MEKLKILKVAMLISMLTISVFVATSRLNTAEAIYPTINGRPLMSDGNGHYCCVNSGNDCGAACCD